MSTSYLCWNPPPLCVPLRRPHQIHLSWSSLSLQQRRQISRNRPSAASWKTDHPSFPFLTALRAINRWRFCDLDYLTPILCYQNMKVVTLLHDSVVTKNLHKATLQACPNLNHFYNLHIKDVLTHLVWFIACLILVFAKLSNDTIFTDSSGYCLCGSCTSVRAFPT